LLQQWLHSLWLVAPRLKPGYGRPLDASISWQGSNSAGHGIEPEGSCEDRTGSGEEKGGCLCEHHALRDINFSLAGKGTEQ